MASIMSPEPGLNTHNASSSRRDSHSSNRASSIPRGTPPTSTTSQHRNSLSTPNGARPPSASRQAQHLANVARRDVEQTSLARAPSQNRRSTSMDRYGVERPRDAQRTPSQTNSPPITRTTSRYVSENNDPNTSNNASSNDQARTSQTTASTTAPRKRTMVTATTGHWNLGKTIGAGSMGKVKLAKNQDSGETCAIKIVPRYSQEGEHKTREDRERADHSKEVRTAREAAIVTLVNHPFICGMRDVVRTNYHWYMLFEYVNGGQMLDYIISHGRLKEKQARKFARQIGSALDYCHRNSIVHRDLKIENILISKTGDIKIIDFGLSNLYAPHGLLKTFCGSLYFAAPELLQARQYLGPEVDVWSFGIVLYVLVCGKVPFDDQSMPQLHAKIKKGVVEYPPWLSHECKHIISRMLVTDPKHRAPLSEILNHPWMSKGFSGPPENYLPHREALQLPLDQAVIDKMTGFDFGSADYITRQLENVIRSEDYQKAIRAAQRKRETHVNDHEKRRSSVLMDFYQRRKSATSRDTLTHSSAETLPLGEDPVNAFSPLLSVYYLVREKQEREKRESNPGALAMPQSPGEQPLKLPEVPSPNASAAVLSNGSEAGQNGEGFRSRRRTRDDDNSALAARTIDTDESQPMVNVSRVKSPVKHQNGVTGIFRKFSTRRHREPDNETQRHSAAPVVNVSKAPDSVQGTPRASISVKRTRDQPPSAFQDVANRHPDLLAPPSMADDATKKGSRGGLGRSISVNSADLRRRWSMRRASSHHEKPAEETPLPAHPDRASMVEPQLPPIESSQLDHEQTLSFRPRTTNRARSMGSRDSTYVKRLRAGTPVESDLPEETDAELAEDYASNARGNESHETMKPIYLKGLFSVSTTSSRPLSYIRNDIIRVLTQIGIEFKEIKNGFSCRHVPSIDLNKVVDPEKSESRPQSNRRRISFAALRSPDKEKANPIDEQPTPSRGSQHRRLAAESNYTTNSEDSEEDDHRLKPGPRAAGETTTQVQSDLGQSMILRFDVLVIKVPIVSLHGIQFKKVEGGTWQYKQMAETILNELKL